MAKHKRLQPQNLDKGKSKVDQTIKASWGPGIKGSITKGQATRGPITKGPAIRASKRQKKIALCQVEMVYWELLNC